MLSKYKINSSCQIIKLTQQKLPNRQKSKPRKKRGREREKSREGRKKEDLLKEQL